MLHTDGLSENRSVEEMAWRTRASRAARTPTSVQGPESDRRSSSKRSTPSFAWCLGRQHEKEWRHMGQQSARGERLISTQFVSLVTCFLFEVVLVARTITALLGPVCGDGPLVTWRVITLVAQGPGAA